MSHRALGIAALGMVSSLGQGAAVNGAAMRAGYDGFQATGFADPDGAGPQLGAPAPGVAAQVRGLARLAALAASAVAEVLPQLGDEPLPVVLCLAEPERPGPLNGPGAIKSLAAAIGRACDGLRIDAAHSLTIQGGRCGFVRALSKAQTIIHDQHMSRVLVLGVDSLLSAAAIHHFGGDLYGDGRRLLGESHSNGFIPGEAATAALLGAPTGDLGEVEILGCGFAEEPATIHTGEVLRADGLLAAIRAACEHSGVAAHETAWRVTGLSGEEYFFREAALAFNRAFERTVPDHPLWHPAAHIGEVGAAVGGAILVQAHQALVRGYAPGTAALCHLSDDGPARAAFLIRYANEESRDG